MELQLDPVIPVTRVVNGHNVFNKGYRHGIRGKTYEEYYGEETGRKKRENMSRKMKGHPYWSNRNAAAKPCVVIFKGKLLGRFDSAIEASNRLGINYATVRRYLERKNKEPQKRLTVVLRERILEMVSLNLSIGESFILISPCNAHTQTSLPP